MLLSSVRLGYTNTAEKFLNIILHCHTNPSSLANLEGNFYLELLSSNCEIDLLISIPALSYEIKIETCSERKQVYDQF